MNTTINRTGTVLIGHVGVDSGQLMVCDPCYIKADDWADESFAPANAVNGKYPFNYNGACGATLSDESAGELGTFGTGVAFASGWGDGNYPVYATYIDGRIARVEIVLIDEDEDDEENEDEDDLL